MNILLVQYQPFVINQAITIYSEETGEVIKEVGVVTDMLGRTIKGLVKDYSIGHIQLKGNQHFLSRFQAELITEFEINDIPVDII